jgi:hypothetical protein
MSALSATVPTNSRMFSARRACCTSRKARPASTAPPCCRGSHASRRRFARWSPRGTRLGTCPRSAPSARLKSSPCSIPGRRSHSSASTDATHDDVRWDRVAFPGVAHSGVPRTAHQRHGDRASALTSDVVDRREQQGLPNGSSSLTHFSLSITVVLASGTRSARYDAQVRDWARVRAALAPSNWWRDPRN